MDGHVARMGTMRNAYKILVVKLEERSQSEDLGANDSKRLKWNLWNYG
jgi:hypothetical protein